MLYSINLSVFTLLKCLCCTVTCFLHQVPPSLIDVCLVLLCSALPHPPTSGFIPFGAPFTPGPFMFSAVPVPPPPGVNIEEHLQIRQEEKRQRINRRHRLEEGRGMAQKMEKNAVWK